MRLRDFHLMALFILVYVGTEVTLGGECRHPLLQAATDIEMGQGGSSRTLSICVAEALLLATSHPVSSEVRIPGPYPRILLELTELR